MVERAVEALSLLQPFLLRFLNCFHYFLFLGLWPSEFWGILTAQAPIFSQYFQGSGREEPQTKFPKLHRHSPEVSLDYQEERQPLTDSYNTALLPSIHTQSTSFPTEFWQVVFLLHLLAVLCPEDFCMVR